MDRRCFTILCHLLRTITGLPLTEVVDVEEMVTMYLHILAHDVKNCVIQREFMHSSEIIFRHFNMVLLAVIRLHDELLKKTTTSTERLHRPKMENCLGALDDMYIKVNVLERSAADSRILRDAISRPNGLKSCNVITGYYYLVDIGYLNAEGFLAPYRCQRYHLQEWRGVENAPSTSKKFFNMKHLSARNVIERAFSVLKSHGEMTNYDIADDIDEVSSTHTTTADDDIHYIETSNEWSQWRDKLVEEMFSNWELHNQ
ncbi:putative nuclease HARBI1 [Cucumis melo var. makuwa]|uniref:Nuclease HARBI1 n=1 Tax=Cucumis melo var. makuwa TaxID=1194695 RepID=A0A5A7UCP5_CUCMM|nr:putative nuclease HARBI1 [Cucumis melo var. makuwa]